MYSEDFFNDIKVKTRIKDNKQILRAEFNKYKFMLSIAYRDKVYDTMTKLGEDYVDEEVMDMFSKVNTTNKNYIENYFGI